MKTVKNTLYTLAAIAVLASCSSNKDLAYLDEYDDLYYTGTERVESKPAQTEFTGDDGSPESAYYGNSGYNEGPSDAEPIEESDGEAYYDPDYTRRIENFHRSDDSDYIYDRAYGSSPRLSLNFGYSSFGPGWGMGFSYGYGNCFGCYTSPWYTPYYYRDPFMWRYSFYYSPFYYRYRFYDPWAPFGYAYYPYSYPYYAYPGYGYHPGWGYPYYGGDYGYHSNVEYTPREDSYRGSRGGVVRTGDRGGVVDGPKDTDSQRARDGRTVRERPADAQQAESQRPTTERERETRQRPTGTRDSNVSPRNDYYDAGERDRVIRSRGDVDRTPSNTRDTRGVTTPPTRRSTPATRPRSPEPTTSPYTRQRSREVPSTRPRPAPETRPRTAPTQRPTRTAPTRTAPTRTAPSRTEPSRNYSTPSMQRSAPSRTPSVSPSPSRSSGGSGRNSSPTRAPRSR